MSSDAGVTRRAVIDYCDGSFMARADEDLVKATRVKSFLDNGVNTRQ
jgi:hypothetical protein